MWELDALIMFWTSHLAAHDHTMTDQQIDIVKSTITQLKLLQEKVKVDILQARLFIGQTIPKGKQSP